MCAFFNPEYADAVQHLRNLGVATVAATGNAGMPTGVSAGLRARRRQRGAMDSSAYPVVALFSNTSSFVSLLRRATP
ncbi:MAG: hypothetical protein U0531_04305 [Dehalococcoidia bacterium]